MDRNLGIPGVTLPQRPVAIKMREFHLFHPPVPTIITLLGAHSLGQVWVSWQLAVGEQDT